MASPRVPKADSAGNARTVIVAVVAVALGAVVLAKGFPKSSGPKVVAGAGAGTATTKPKAGTPATSSTSAVPGASTVAPTATTLNLAASKVIVANGAQVEGIAGKITKVLQDKGYITVAPTTTAGPASVSTVYFQPGFQGVADKAAADLGIKTVAAMPATKPVDIKDGVVLVVLGTDFSETKVPAGSQLKPATPTTTVIAPPAAAVTTPTTKKP
jgi:LytR cell envelope-related transcriptional attenuator